MALRKWALLSLTGFLYAAFIYWGYLTFIDTKDPVTVSYQHRYFTSRSVQNRADAVRYEIREAKPGDVVFLYQEYCLSRKIIGTVYSSWINGSVFNLEPTGNVGTKGCFKASFVYRIPYAVTGNVKLKVRIEYKLNYFTKVTHHFEPVSVRVIHK